jgi:hypothetical protein
MAMLKLKPFDPEELNKCKIIEERFVCSICIDIFGNIELLKNHYIAKVSKLVFLYFSEWNVMFLINKSNSMGMSRRRRSKNHW